jgi:hypothetical protein
MGLYALLFFIPALAAMAIAKLYFHWKYTWGEFALQAGGTLVVLFALFFAGSVSVTHDTQLLNGVVTDLNPQQESCPVGWRDFTDDFCTEYTTRSVYSHTTCTGTGSNKVCTRHYDTEYKYIYEWERRYFVKTDLPNTYEISRVDRQGAVEPPRFAEIAIGDPVTQSVSYTNYIKGASASLFAKDNPVEPVPIAYPQVQDYYKANCVIITGYASTNEFYTQWNKSISKVNANIRKTGANVIVVLTGNPEIFAESLARTWQAHNINDVIVVIGMSEDTIAWVDVRSWSNNSLVNVEIKNEIMNLKTLDTQAVDAIIERAVLDHYELKSMEDFEYLADDIAPPMWAYILAVIVLLIATPAVTYLFHKHDVL